MFLWKTARPNIDKKSFLYSRVNDTTKVDWKKLLWDDCFFKGTINDVLMLEADYKNTLIWYIDVSLAVHANMKSHTGVVFKTKKGAIISSSTKQKLN